MANKFETMAYKAIGSYTIISCIIGIIGLICSNIKFNVQTVGYKTTYSTLDSDQFIFLLIITMISTALCLLLTCVVKVILEKVEKARDWYIEFRKTRALKKVKMKTTGV